MTQSPETGTNLGGKLMSLFSKVVSPVLTPIQNKIAADSFATRRNAKRTFDFFK